VAWLAALYLLTADPLARVGCDVRARASHDGVVRVTCGDGRRFDVERLPSCEEPPRCDYLPNTCVHLRAR
jgi:hypothetical protein